MGKKGEKKLEGKKKKGRVSCCEREGLRRGAWTAEEDKILVHFITHNGHGTWPNLPKLSGLRRCGKSCRLRWTNYLRPDIKRGPFTHVEKNTIIQLHETLGNKWAAIASQLPGRTDNDIKNFWNSHLRKRLGNKTLDRPSSSSKMVGSKQNSPLTRHMSQLEDVRVESESHLSVKPLPLNVIPAGPITMTMQGNYFINLWTSEVGQSFRNANEFENPMLHTSALTKAESCKKTSSPQISEPRVDVCKESDDMADQMEDAMIELLLDFPVGDNDMGFLQETADHPIF